MKLSNHSKQRMRERTDFNHQERRRLFRDALHNGLTIERIKDEKFKKFLLSKNKCKIKIYKGYIFIYSKNNKQLYTMYPIPERFLEGSEVDG